MNIRKYIPFRRALAQWLVQPEVNFVKENAEKLGMPNVIDQERIAKHKRSAIEDVLALLFVSH